jgi:hypothetical protein
MFKTGIPCSQFKSQISNPMPNPAVDPVPFRHRTLRDKAAQRP